jgi:spore coat polysaccharide biosynthesis protein SpsF
MIDHAMRSLLRVPASVHALLTDEASADSLAERARDCGYELFVGSPADVLDRYVRAAHEFGVELVVRATGDNPLVSWELANMAVRRARAAGTDYFAFDGPPLGTGVEVVRSQALDVASSESTSAYDHEHVCPYLYGNPERFRVERAMCPPAYRAEGSKVTVDTPEEYEAVCRVFAECYDDAPVPVARLLRFLRESA